MQKVAIVGASPKPERYANKAMHMLQEYGHQCFLVTPLYDEIDGQKTYPSLLDIATPLDTVTIYLSPERQSEIIDQLLKLTPGRVIFNPGSENPDVYPQLRKQNIALEEACTLVLLKTNQFSLLAS